MKYIKLISLIGILALSSACRKNIETNSQIANADSLPRAVLDSTAIFYSDSAQTQMKLFAMRIIEHSHLDTPYTEFIDRVQGSFFDKNMQVRSSLQADYAVYHQQDDLWEYKGDVRLKNEQGDILTTEHLYADQEEEKIYSVVRVKIASPDGSEITGDGGFESNLQFTEYMFTDVSGKINQ